MEDRFLKRVEYNFVNGQLLFINGEVYLEDPDNLERELLEIHEEDTLLVYKTPRGEKRPVRWKKKLKEIINYPNDYNHCPCKLFPHDKGRIVLYEDNIASLFDYNPGEVITVVLNLEENVQVSGKLLEISVDRESFEIETEDLGDTASFKFNEVRYVAKGNNKLEF